MEGMPRFPMLTAEPKESAVQYDDAFILNVKEYILMHFQADPSDFDSALQEIREMKRKISKATVDVESALVLKRYYAQLLMMKNRFPMEDGGALNTPFSWFDRINDGTTAQTFYDINFELATVMFQIGAVHGCIAAAEDRSNEDSIKRAFMHFQYAAWPFQNLRDNMDVARFGCPDFEKELLTFYVNVYLAQAQECLVEKSLIDHRKSIIVAKLTVYLRDLYKSCSKNLTCPSLGEIVPSSRLKSWSRFCIIKSEIYGCLTMISMGMNAEEEQKFGDRLGYYKAAEIHLNNAIKACDKEDKPTIRESVAFVRDVVTVKLENAQKENDFIYHQKIPNVDDLPGSLEGLCKVKSLSFDPLDPSVGGDDIFGALLPPTVLSSVSQYEEAKSSLKREVMQRVEQKNVELESFLTALNAGDLRLENSAEPLPLPEMLMERNAAMNSQPDAVPDLLRELQAINDLARQAEQHIGNLQNRLNRIDLPELRVDEGYQAINEEVTRLNEHHLQARKNNGELHEALAAHTASLQLLSQPLRELTKSVSGQSGDDVGPSPEGEKLSKLLSKVQEMQVQRATVMQRLSDELASDNITKRLLAERDSDCQSTYTAELKKHDQTIKYIDLNLTAQENILQLLTDANADFAEQRRHLQDNNSERNKKIMTLVAAYDIFSDVVVKANEGNEFYQKLLGRLTKLAIAVDGMESAYVVEKEKREKEKQALESKMQALRASREARDAMNDFQVDPMGPRAPRAQPPASGQGGAADRGRARMGDYMEFYRNKMGGGGGPPAASAAQLRSPLPPVSYETPYGLSQPPSPAPSSIGDYLHNESSPSPYPSHQQQFPHYPPPGLQPGPQPPVQHQPPPTSINYALPHQYHNTAPSYPSPAPPPTHYAPPQASRHDQHNYAPFVPPQPYQQQQQQPPAHLPQQQQQTFMPPGLQAGYQGYHHQPQQLPTSGPSHPPGLPPGLPQQFHHQPQPGALQQLGQQQQQQQHVPTVSSSSSHSYHQQPPAPYGQQPPQGYAPQQYQPPVQQQPPAPVQQQQPPAPVPNHQQQQQQPQYQQFVNKSIHDSIPPNLSSHHQPINHSQNTFYTSSFNQQPQSIPTSHIAPQDTPILSSTSDTSYSKPHLTSSHIGNIMQNPVPSGIPPSPQPSFQNQIPPPASQAPSTHPGTLPVSHSNLNQQSPLPNATTGFAPFQPQQPSLGNLTSSPWHRNSPAPDFGRPQQPVQPQMQPQAQPQFPYSQPPQQQQPGGYGQQAANKQVSNVDLLTSLTNEMSLTPALQPQAPPPQQQQYQQQQYQQQQQQHYQAAPPTPPQVPVMNNQQQQQTNSNGVESQGLLKKASPPMLTPTKQYHVHGYSASSTISISPAPQRPAAAVLPFVQKEEPLPDPTENLSMINASTISIQPVPQTQNSETKLLDLLDAQKFTIGEGDRMKLEKKQLHNAIRNAGEKPPIDPNDPLNQLNPYWNIH